MRCLVPLTMLLTMHQPHLHRPWRLDSCNPFTGTQLMFPTHMQGGGSQVGLCLLICPGALHLDSAGVQDVRERPCRLQDLEALQLRVACMCNMLRCRSLRVEAAKPKSIFINLKLHLFSTTYMYSLI